MTEPPAITGAPGRESGWATAAPLWSPSAGRMPAYGLVLAVFAAGLANLLIVRTPGPVATFLLVVILSAWFGGTRPGVFAIALSLAALGYLLGNPSPGVTTDVVRVAYFAAISSFVVWIIVRLRGMSLSLRVALDEVQRHNEALRGDNAAGKALEERLRRSEGEMRSVVDTIPTMAWIVQPDGRIEFLNRRWLDYTGLTLEQAVVQSNAAMHPDDSPRALEKWSRAMADAAGFEDEMRLRGADGEYRWFLVRTVPLLGADGRVVRWYGTSMDIEDRKRAEDLARRGEQALRELAGRLRSLSRRLLEVQEDDRRHLARELHDEFGQILAAIKLHLHAARSTAGEAARPNLEEAMSLLQRAGEQVRSLALELRPVILDTAGLDGALRWLARQHEQRTGMRTEVVGQWRDPGSDVAIACFRVVQEALTNVTKHSRARHVWIEIDEDERGRHLGVRDDGAGFDVGWVLEHAPAQGHLGLLGMKERVQILGGTLQVESAAGCGTRLRICLPSTAEARPVEAA